MKFWTNNDKGDDKIIAYHENTLYIVNPPVKELDAVLAGLEQGVIPKTMSTDIPLSYMKQIHMEEGKTYIEVLFGNDSTQHLKIQDNIQRNDVFNYLRSGIEGATYKLDTYSKLRAGKKPLIAMGVVAGIFLWTYSVSQGMEQGEEYRVVGSQRSLAGIVLLMASMGQKNMILLFGSLLAIALTSFILKIKNPKVVHTILIR